MIWEAHSLGRAALAGSIVPGYLVRQTEHPTASLHGGGGRSQKKGEVRDPI